MSMNWKFKVLQAASPVLSPSTVTRWMFWGPRLTVLSVSVIQRAMAAASCLPGNDEQANRTHCTQKCSSSQVRHIAPNASIPPDVHRSSCIEKHRSPSCSWADTSRSVSSMNAMSKRTMRSLLQYSRHGGRHIGSRVDFCFRATDYGPKNQKKMSKSM